MFKFALAIAVIIVIAVAIFAPEFLTIAALIALVIVIAACPSIFPYILGFGALIGAGWVIINFVL